MASTIMKLKSELIGAMQRCSRIDPQSSHQLFLKVLEAYTVMDSHLCSHSAPERKDGKHKDKAARALRFTSKDLLEFGVVDEVVPEPLGGAHRDHRRMATTLKGSLIAAVRDLKSLSPDELVERRYQKFRAMGVFDQVEA